MIALICGRPPVCDRCAVNDADIKIELPHPIGERLLCEECTSELLVMGLNANSQAVVATK